MARDQLTVMVGLFDHQLMLPNIWVILELSKKLRCLE